MAILFNDASSQYLVRTDAVIAGLPFSMGCWFNSDSLTVTQTLMSIGHSGSVANYRMDVSGGSAGDPVRAIVQNAGGSTAFVNSTIAYTPNAWHHALNVYASTTSRTVYLDGGNSAENTTSLDVGTPDRTAIGALVRSTVLQYMSGMVADAAIWNAALSADDAASLAAGISPLLVRRDALVSYWRLLGNDAPTAIDLVGGNGLTWTNTPVKAAHPRIILPRRRSIIGVPAAGGTPVTSLRGLHAISIGRGTNIKGLSGIEFGAD